MKEIERVALALLISSRGDTHQPQIRSGINRHDI